MTTDQLNNYIKHYIEEDKTRQAIMLTGGWGTGKSFYIKNTLIPFLEKEENGSHKCISVSLYGMNTMDELGKSIFLEAFLIWQEKNKAISFINNFKLKHKTGSAIGAFAAKTLLRNATGLLGNKIGSELSVKDSDLQALYDAIDLKGYLVILEDIERAKINIIELLGYVNNLVEQDGIKVLLIANENELIRYENGNRLVPDEEDPFTRELNEDSSEKKQKIKYSSATEEYLSVKEKTIGDTIRFHAEPHDAILQIISGYDPLKNYFNGDRDAEKIEDILQTDDGCNLRTFIFAAQKTNDILQRINEAGIDYDIKFYRSVFYGIIAFSCKLRAGEKLAWKDNKNYSYDLGGKVPLYRFCFDYIMNQSFALDDVAKAAETFEELYKYDENRSDNDKAIKTLENYYVLDEDTVRNALRTIENKLRSQTAISLYQYGHLARYIVLVGDVLEYDTKKIRESLVKNLEGHGDRIDASKLFPFPEEFHNEAAQKEYDELQEAMIASLNSANSELFDYDYSLDNFDTFCERIQEGCRNGTFLNYGAFAARLNIEKLIEVLKKCTSKQINDFRWSIIEIYRLSNIQDYLSGDYHSITKLRRALQELLNYEGYDKIQINQIDMFLDNLDEIILKLKP